MRSSDGFTLIELMVVIAIIAIIASIGIPKLIASRMTANEASAVATLRSLTSVQAQFQTTAKADIDYDGTGEFGCFQELSGAWNVRDNAMVGKLNPPVLSGRFRTPSAANGGVAQSGYFFIIALPRADGNGVACDANPALFSTVDTDLSETTWCAYAWPVTYGTSGSRTFFVNQTGDITATEDSNYSGDDPMGGSFSSAFRTTQAGSITGQLAIGTRAFDGNFWRRPN